MLPGPLDYLAPATLADAIAALASDPEALLIGASPRTVIDLKMRRVLSTRSIDLRLIAELRGITADRDILRIGSMTTLRLVMDDAAIRSRCTALAMAAEQSGDAQLRNMETILGCLTRDLAGSGVAAALLASDATVELVGPAGPRAAGIDDLASDPRATASHGEIVTAVTVSAPGRSAYVQISHPATLDPVCGVAVVLQTDPRGAVVHGAFAVAGATTRPTRLPRAEALFSGLAITNDTIRSAAAVAADGLDFVSDSFASADYRAHLVGVLLTRALASFASLPAS